MSDELSSNIAVFFKSPQFVWMIDRLARRYGKTPYEILTEQTIFEFSFNVAVMISAFMEEKKPKPQMQPWNRFGIHHRVVKKGT